MAIGIGERLPQHGGSDRKLSFDYHVIFVLSFAFFLVAAVIEKLLPWTWWRKSNDARSRSVISRALGGARTCTAYAFMG